MPHTKNMPENTSPDSVAVARVTPPQTLEPTLWDKIWANVKTIGSAVAVAMAIRILFFEAFEIEGPSMEPTLLNGDRVVVSKFLYGLFLPFGKQAVLNWGRPNPGDVVIVKSPADDIDIVKRVAAVAGDTVEIRDDVIYRNGQPLFRGNHGACRADEASDAEADCMWVSEKNGEHAYITSHSKVSAVSNFEALKIPPGHIYVLGDHRDRSNDSRFFGPVPINRIKGKGLFIYWSSDEHVRFGRMFHSIK